MKIILNRDLRAIEEDLILSRKNMDTCLSIIQREKDELNSFVLKACEHWASEFRLDWRVHEEIQSSISFPQRDKEVLRINVFYEFLIEKQLQFNNNDFDHFSSYVYLVNVVESLLSSIDIITGYINNGGTDFDFLRDEIKKKDEIVFSIKSLSIVKNLEENEDSDFSGKELFEHILFWFSLFLESAEKAAIGNLRLSHYHSLISVLRIYFNKIWNSMRKWSKRKKIFKLGIGGLGLLGIFTIIFNLSQFLAAIITIGEWFGRYF